MKLISNLKRRWAVYFRPDNQVKEPTVTVLKIPKKWGKLKLSDVFTSEKKYQYVMDILVQQEMISPVNYQWIDMGKSYKKLIVALLKFLKVQGYYKDHLKLTNEKFQEISYNTFGIEIGIDHIKHTSYKDAIINYIPPAYTLFTT